MALFSPLETSVGEGSQRSQARRVGQGKISQRRRGQRTCRTGVSQDNGPRLDISWMAAGQPRSDAGQRLAQKGKGRLGRVQAAGPAAEGGGIGEAIGVVERGVASSQ